MIGDRINLPPAVTDEAALARAEGLAKELAEELAAHGQTVKAESLYREAQRLLDGLGFPADGHVGDRIRKGRTYSRVIVAGDGWTYIVQPDGSGSRHRLGFPQETFDSSGVVIGQAIA